MRPYRRKMHSSWRRRSSGFFSRIYDYLLPFVCHLYHFWRYQRTFNSIVTKLAVTLFCVLILILPLLYLIFVPFVTVGAFQHVLMGLETAPVLAPAKAPLAPKSPPKGKTEAYAPPSSMAVAGMPPKKDVVSELFEYFKQTVPLREKKRVAMVFREKRDNICFYMAALVLSQEYIMAYRSLLFDGPEMEVNDFDNDVILG